MASSAGVVDARVERKVEELYEFAAKCGETELLDMFNRTYVTGMIRGSYKEAEPGRIIQTLRKADETRLKLHRLEDEMDKDLFKKLVTSGYLVRSGRDKESGAVMFWYSLRALNKNTWRLRAASAQEKAHVRATVWISEALTAQTISSFGCGKPAQSVCMDLSSGMVDFNTNISEQTLRLLSDLLPIQDGSRIYAFGVPKPVPWMFNCIRRMLPTFSETLQVMHAYDDALDIVDDPNDVPDFWICADSTTDAYAMVRTSTWCYERCLSNTNKVTTRDLFNPGEWPYSSETELSKVALTEKKTMGLECIGESDGGEEDDV